MVLLMFITGRSIATFNNTSYASYQPPSYINESLNSIDISLRTRTQNGTILSIISSPLSISLLILNGHLTLACNGSTTSVRLETTLSIADGQWRYINLIFNSSSIVVSSNGSSVSSLSVPKPIIMASVSASTLVYIGNNPAHVDFNKQELKGCLGTAHINGYPLPFVKINDSLLTNQSAHYFNIISSRNLFSGCVGDPVCEQIPCANGGICTDLWNEYVCGCPVGYSGMQCEVNIDDCESKPCMNGASCTDLVANYKCTCNPGYTGNRLVSNVYVLKLLSLCLVYYVKLLSLCLVYCVKLLSLCLVYYVKLLPRVSCTILHYHQVSYLMMSYNTLTII